MHIRLQVKEVREEAPGYVKLYGVLEIVELPEKTQEKIRIVQVGPRLGDDERVEQQIRHHVQSFGDQVAETLEKRFGMQRPPTPLAAAVCFWLKKEYFERMGRPTVDDYIVLDARSYRP